MKKKYIYIAVFSLLLPLHTWACELCQQQQPKILRGVTHGSGPTGNIDYIIISGAAIIVAITLFFSIKYLVRPQESAPDHIKNITTHQPYSHGRK